jgi:hypothetical protein
MLQQHVSAITRQIQTDCHFLYDSLSKQANDDRGVDDLYALGRLSCAAKMTITLLSVPFASNPLSLALIIGDFVLAHDIFQALKNRQELEQNQLFSPKIVATIGKGIFSGGKNFIKSVLEGKSDDEIAMNTIRATFNEAASLQSKNTFLKPVWNEMQLQLAVRGYNPFPAM